MGTLVSSAILAVIKKTYFQVYSTFWKLNALPLFLHIVRFHLRLEVDLMLLETEGAWLGSDTSESWEHCYWPVLDQCVFVFSPGRVIICLDMCVADPLTGWCTLHFMSPGPDPRLGHCRCGCCGVLPSSECHHVHYKCGRFQPFNASAGSHNSP